MRCFHEIVEYSAHAFDHKPMLRPLSEISSSLKKIHGLQQYFTNIYKHSEFLSIIHF